VDDVAALLALTAAVCFALAATLWQKAALHLEGVSFRHPLSFAVLLGQWIWLLGLLVQIVGVVLQAAALDRGRVSIVQPLLVTTVIWALPLGYFLTHQTIGRREILGAAIIVVGLAGFAVFGDPAAGVEDGEPGELVTRGPYTIRGYYNAPEKNAEAFLSGGWYRMGDVVRKRGRYVYTEGRRNDMINRGGEKISCEEVENLIYTHPKVKVVTLVAMPDPLFGEKACAFVVPKPGETIVFEELIAFLRQQNIASFKLPERLEVVSELPLSPVGKIMKRELRDMITAKLAREAAGRGGP